MGEGEVEDFAAGEERGDDVGLGVEGEGGRW